MITLVDSNVILDLVTNDPKWAAWSAEALARAADQSVLAINPLIFAEIAIGFATVEELEDLLPPEDFRRLDLPWEAAFLAGKAFLAYRRRGGRRSAPLADFHIGAHAAVAGLRLLTRDARRYRTYFPTVTILAPDEKR
ncbi:MAG TPA: type II toxin-antitoxin system VapC family toxin [Thermoanaerobaculia bacterium]|nr:type II toxin-antitoxin system VapC family toxin [Thermoanaerobaculia bacterium]